MPHVIRDPIESPAEPAGIVRASVDIAAPAADVFRALVDPHELAAWLGGEPMPSHPREPRDSDASRALPGTRWRAPAIAPDGTTGDVSGEYLGVAPPYRLETTWRASWNDFATERVRFELVPIEVGGVEGTRVTVTHTRAQSRLHATTSALAHASVRGAEGWPSLLARLAVHVATTGTLVHDFDALHRAVVDLHHAR
ncbi:MAG: hypothetical protein DMD35_09185 [Gemmatimonadetes bacterium]|nr:MAG: hypothetical protein DMD35_09185 [Gemmatimonadota bacterium]